MATSTECAAIKAQMAILEALHFKGLGCGLYRSLDIQSKALQCAPSCWKRRSLAAQNSIGPGFRASAAQHCIKSHSGTKLWDLIHSSGTISTRF